jgi:iron complex outermembrane receptor protein
MNLTGIDRCKRVGALLAILWAAGLAWPVAGRADTNIVATLKQLSLEDLMDIDVTSVSRKSEKFSNVPAAVYVITAEDIRRSGATSIPEALRLAPGLTVAQVDARQWAVSSRGFNDLFANKLLVLIDGRSVYTPLFSGVLWDMRDVMLEDVDRIEVIRGPGATVWGANAVNGVINIITKPARDTQGGLATAGYGTELQGFGALRYGGQLGETAHYRVYGKFFNRDDSELRGGGDADDRWQQGRFGFRMDWDVNQLNDLMVQGDVFAGREHDVFTVPTPAPPFSALATGTGDVSGGFMLARWHHRFLNDTDLEVQAFYDNTLMDTAVLRELRHTFDIEAQHRFRWGDRQEIVWGGGYRMTADDTTGSALISFDPSDRTTGLYSLFVQDEIALVPDRFKVTLGSKFEYNDYTGFEAQPGARLLWTPQAHHTVWASVSRAVRTPSRAEHDVIVNPPGVPPGLVPVTGTDGFESETLIAYEAGYRLEPARWLQFDWAAFYNVYDDLRTIEPPQPPPGPATGDNLMDGESYGFEFVTRWQPKDWWRIEGQYTLLLLALHRQSASNDPVAESPEGTSPQQQIALRSRMDLPGRIELDLGVRYVDELPSLGIRSYIVMDARLAWHATASLELSVVGQSLFERDHPEFASSFIGTPLSEVEQGVYGKITWKF